MPPTVGDLVRLAFSLSLLTFYTGVLIYSLPIPYRGLKSWAPRLIADSVLAAGLAAAFYAILEVPAFIRSVLGASWALYESRVALNLAAAAAVKALAYVIKEAAGIVENPIVGVVAGVAVSLLAKLADLAIATAIALQSLGWLAMKASPLLAALGLVLYSIPLRLGRGAGAWLLALALVLPALLPALPLFEAAVAHYAGGYGAVQAAAAQGVVVDAWGSTIGYGVLLFYPANATPEGEPLARYPIIGGRAQGFPPGSVTITFPPDGSSSAYLELDGLRALLYPAPVDFTAIRVEDGVPVLVLQAKLVLFHDGLLAAFASNIPAAATLNRGPGHVEIQVIDDMGAYVEVRWPKSCDVTVQAEADVGGVVVEPVGEWEWAGVEGEGARVVPTTREAAYRVIIDYAGDCGEKPSPSPVKDYLFDQLMGRVNLTVIATYVFTGLFLLPATYLALLALLVGGVARALGGRDRGIPRPV